MPRATGATHFYHSQFSTPPVHYLHDDQLSPTTPTSANGQPGPPSQTQKKKHICPTCDRAFTTSGHLARHSRVHTGERNHKCPFPGCETRCSRQDNLQQQYVYRFLMTPYFLTTCSFQLSHPSLTRVSQELDSLSNCSRDEQFHPAIFIWFKSSTSRQYFFQLC
jgi:hypothetical protein